jgi:kynurenine formamidase
MSALEFSADGRQWRAELGRSADLAIRLEFDGAQPRFFAPEPARARPLQAGSFTGSVALGASCTCALHTLAPHCHGTHTECVGHVTDDGTHVAALTPVPPALALLVSVAPTPRVTAEANATWASGDPVITRAVLEAAAAPWIDVPWRALVVRTLPNDPSKRSRAYEGACAAPYFLADAMQWIVARDVRSLVVDLPSLDRADDGGALAAHRLYWGLPPGSRRASEARRADALVTELAYVDDGVRDGLYLLDLQVPAFVSDAAPSRPVLYPVREVVTEGTR